MKTVIMAGGRGTREYYDGREHGNMLPRATF